MKYFAIGIVILGIIASIFGKSFASQAPAGVLSHDGGFIDIDLPIASQRTSSDKSLTIVGRGKLSGETVAVAVELGPDWKVQERKDVGLTLYWGTGTISSVGTESDRLLALLAREYGSHVKDAKMAARTQITVVGLNSDPRSPGSGKITMKVFFEHGAQENYGEAFINVDLANGVLEFHDKDPEYHNGILASLEAGT